MSRTESGITTVNVNPDYLTKYREDKSLDEMDQYRELPRANIVQGMTAQALKDAHGEGSLIVQPGGGLLIKKDQKFLFVPVLFFAEYLLWSDREDKDSPNVLQRSYDPLGEIAKKAANIETRYEVYDGHENRPESDQWRRRYVQHFRFVGIVYDPTHPLHNLPFTLSFERGENYQGLNFIAAIKMRKHPIGDEQVQIPLFAQVWEIGVGFRDRGTKKWWGLEFSIPEPGLVHQDHIAELESLHKDMKELKAKDKLLVDESSGDEEDPAAVSASAEL